MDCPRWTQFLGPYYGIDHVHEASEDEKSHKCSRMCAIPSEYKYCNRYLKQRFLEKFLGARGVGSKTEGEPQGTTGTVARATGVLDALFFKKPDAMAEFNRTLDDMADNIDTAVGGPWTLCSVNVNVVENVTDKTVALHLAVDYKHTV